MGDGESGREETSMIRDYIQPIAPFVLIVLLVVIGYFSLDYIIHFVRRFVAK